MKVALLGDGKTGGHVKKQHGDVVAFNLENPPTVEKLIECDVVISFLPGPAILEYIDLLVAAKIPVASGSTGTTYPENLDQRLKQQNVTWIKSHNFSLGMNVVRLMIEEMAKLKTLIPNYESVIHEVHHTHKLDAPSGTALSWNDWWGGDANMTHERTGDVVGFHEITFKSETEEIKLSHDAKNRGIFAQGALFAAKLLHNKEVKPGLNDFNLVVRNILFQTKEG